MYLQSLATAFPETSYTQRETWEALTQGATEKLSRRSRKILETVLHGSSGIDKRHFALPPHQLFNLGAGDLNHAFEREAPILAAAAVRKSWEPLGVQPRDIDALIVTTCTGYLCPGVSSHLGEQLGLRRDAYQHDVAGHGCAAALPTLEAVYNYAAAHPEALIAMVTVEICSAAFFLADDTGVLVSACLFGDGAAAALWRGRKLDDTPQWRAGNFRSLHRPEQREKIRFINDRGFLRNQLHEDVPFVAAESVAELFALRSWDPDQIIAHTGGRDVIDAIETVLPAYRLHETREALRLYGNLSSPSMLVALEERLRNFPDDRRLWLTSFGAGFAAHSCELTRE